MEIPKILKKNVAFMMDRTSRDYQTYFDEEMSSLNLTRSQWLLLVQLYFFDGCNQRELSDVMGVGRAGLGRLTLKLEEKGWIRRESDSADARAFKLFITEDARSLVQGLVDLLLEETENSLRGFEQAEIELLQSFMLRIQSNIRASKPSKRWERTKGKVLSGMSKLQGFGK